MWDLATGARKDEVAGDQVAFADAGIGTKAGIGRYIVSKKDDLVFLYDTRVGANGGADGEEKVLTAFFRAPSAIVSVSCAGDKIAVGCQSGAVLTLHAAWLTDGGAVVEEVEDEEEQEEGMRGGGRAHRRRCGVSKVAYGNRRRQPRRPWTPQTPPPPPPASAPACRWCLPGPAGRMIPCPKPTALPSLPDLNLGDLNLLRIIVLLNTIRQEGSLERVSVECSNTYSLFRGSTSKSVCWYTTACSVCGCFVPLNRPQRPQAVWRRKQRPCSER